MAVYTSKFRLRELYGNVKPDRVRYEKEVNPQQDGSGHTKRSPMPDPPLPVRRSGPDMKIHAVVINMELKYDLKL